MPLKRSRLRPILTGAVAWLAGLALASGLMRAHAAPPDAVLVSAAQICQCGDGQCQPVLCGETATNCSADCSTQAVCGDGVCQNNEGPLTCPQDCLLPPNNCGNGVCDPDENPVSCPLDCLLPTSTCGNGVCDPNESSLTCPADCPRPPEGCGNGVCDADEGPVTCPLDCPLPTTTCGNGVCDPNEGPITCPLDCNSTLPVCGDGLCALVEVCRCAADCVVVGFCGDNVCGVCETALTCFQDCRPTRTPLPTRTPTPRPTATRPASTDEPPVDEPTATVEAQSSATLTAEPSPTAEDDPPQSAPLAEVSGGCVVLPASQIQAEVRQALGSVKGIEATDWVICDKPPRRVCLPLGDPPPGTLMLYDCGADGECEPFLAGGPEEDIICMNNAQTPTCAEGCVFARRVLILGLSPEEATGGAIVLLILLFGGPLLFMFISRRGQPRVEYEDIPSGPVDAWDGL